MQVLYLEHSVESLGSGGPRLLGTIRKGSSCWRSLKEAESATYGGSARRRLYGCIIKMFHPDSAGAFGRCTSFNGGDEKGEASGMFKQLLLTWSQVF